MASLPIAIINYFNHCSYNMRAALYRSFVTLVGVIFFTTPDGNKPIIWLNFPENCMKMKECGPRGVRIPDAPLDPSMDIQTMINISNACYCTLMYSIMFTHIKTHCTFFAFEKMKFNVFVTHTHTHTHTHTTHTHIHTHTHHTHTHTHILIVSLNILVYIKMYVLSKIS